MANLLINYSKLALLWCLAGGWCLDGACWVPKLLLCCRILKEALDRENQKSEYNKKQMQHTLLYYNGYISS
jgi:hypothetical protein